MSPNSAGLAKKMGFGSVSVYLEGLPGWKKEGHLQTSGVEFVRSGNIVLVDLRGAEDVAAGHIPRAIGIPAELLDDHDSEFPKNRMAPIVFYDNKDEDAVKAMAEVKEWGYQNVTLFPGGTASWLAQGHSLEAGPAGTTIRWERKLDPGEISREDFEKALQADSTVIVDARSPEDYAKGHFKGAVNIPAEEITARASELPRDKLIIVHCSTGSRAEVGYDCLREKKLNVKFLKQNIAFNADGTYEMTD